MVFVISIISVVGTIIVVGLVVALVKVAGVVMMVVDLDLELCFKYLRFIFNSIERDQKP